MRAGGWLEAPVPLTEKVWGERLGILGLGRIGKAIARRGEAFRMDIAYHGRTRQPDVRYRYHETPVDLARDVKILVCAIPGRDETRGLVDRDVIDALGPGGYFINISRGTTVDEPYLVDALVNKRLAGAGLDVFADEPRDPRSAVRARQRGPAAAHRQRHARDATRDGPDRRRQPRCVLRRPAAAVADSGGTQRSNASVVAEQARRQFGEVRATRCAQTVSIPSSRAICSSSRSSGASDLDSSE